MRFTPAFVGAAMVVAAASAWADPVPSADAMVDSLSGVDLAKPCSAGCRGIRAQSAPAVAPSRPGEPAKAASGRGVLDLPVLFATGSANVAPAAGQMLTRLGQALTSTRLAANRFRIEGHTDTVGDAAQNQALSEQRAASVAAFLEAKFGIDAARLETVGMGEKDLAVATPDQTPEARNRRVHIVNLGP